MLEEKEIGKDLIFAPVIEMVFEVKCEAYAIWWIEEFIQFYC